MGRTSKVNDDSSSTYSVVQMPGFKMDLHKKQQNLIFSDLNASRQKLADENQMLRDELAEAKMIIRLLKMKLEESDAKASTAPVNSKDSTVKRGIPSNYTQTVDRSKMKRYIFKQKAPTRKEAFMNPSPPGGKAFSLRRRSLSPPHVSRRISPRSSFSPIDRKKCEEEKVEGGVIPVVESRMEEVVEKMEKARIKH